MSCLVVCPHCGRHIRMSETACPFCDGNVAGMVKRCARGVSGRGLSRLTVVTLVAAGLEVTDCSDGQDIYGAPIYGIYDGGLGGSTGGFANCLPVFGPCPTGGASTTGGRVGTGGAAEAGITDAADGSTRD